mmetsp:Transcript_20169/g.28269  ORF Transcript_20169/g.28269 Transcript_20169/m.28269 type:complete len:335 (-) Transcript_20169:298-1302(-)
MSKLQSDHRMVNQSLSKGLSLVGILERFFQTASSVSHSLDDNSPSLVVEVVHDVLESLVLLSNEVLNWNFHILKGNVGCSRSPDTRAVHLACGNSRERSFNKKERNTSHSRSSSSNSHSEVVSPNTVGNPFLLSIDNVVLSISSLGSSGSEVSNITSSSRFGDSQANNLLSRKAVSTDLVLKVFGTKLHHRRKSNAQTSTETPNNTSRSTSAELIHHYQFVEVFNFFWFDSSNNVRSNVLCWPWRTNNQRKPSSLEGFGIDFFWKLLSFIPFVNKRQDFFGHPLSHGSSNSAMRFVVVWAVPSLVPVWITKWDCFSKNVWIDWLHNNRSFFHWF